MTTLSKSQKDEVFINLLRANLVRRGFAVAVPRPDIVGEDLWFTREGCAPRIYLAQSKSMWKRDDQGRYVQNVAERWFQRALHMPNFLYIFGPLDEVGGARFGFVPASLLRGYRFLLQKKGKRPVVNLYLDVSHTASTTFTLHNGEKYGDRFKADVTECFGPQWESGLAKCLDVSHASTCLITESNMEMPFIGKKGKQYPILGRCSHCSTEYLSDITANASSLKRESLEIEVATP
jgi:hypothetical protein